MPKACCQLFITELETIPPTWEVQVQVPLITLNLTATDLDFLRRVRDFIAETHGNPEFRDTTADGITYRPVSATIDLSEFFDASVQVRKNGEYDDAYVVSVGSGALSTSFELRGEQLESWREELDYAIDEWLDPPC